MEAGELEKYDTDLSAKTDPHSSFPFFLRTFATLRETISRFSRYDVVFQVPGKVSQVEAPLRLFFAPAAAPDSRLTLDGLWT
ncbi:MAG: hypothetical protein ABI878_15865 [Acidobacteriota bacterium]